MSESREIRQLLSIIDQAYDHRSWHGTNLRGSIRGLSAARAARRPRPGRHNIWELVVHAAYWKYAVTRRLTGQKRGSFPLKGSNWFPRTQSPSEEQWRDDVALLEKTHRALREAVANLSSGDLSRTPKGRSTSNAFLITGIAAHDLYHAGQIQLLKKL
ncbi:MAG TPA: DinB family protein [Gemmatimonadaceae bacterium]|nr:DinB family protein [Gemmatimonadaceae bacterium]